VSDLPTNAAEELLWAVEQVDEYGEEAGRLTRADVAVLLEKALNEARAEVVAAVRAIHKPGRDTDYVSIPPRRLTVCFACPLSDGFQEWPCDTEMAIVASMVASDPKTTPATHDLG
jgi:hypothetical protein